MPPRASLEGRFRVDIGDEKGQFARYRRWHLRRMARTALGSLHGVGSESEFDPVAACFERQLCVMQLKRSNGRSWPRAAEWPMSRTKKARRSGLSLESLGEAVAAKARVGSPNHFAFTAS